MIDYHSHFLPGIDDGSKSINESLYMLSAWINQGVDNIVATPHFYADRNTPEKFLEDRKRSYNSLKKAISGYSPELQAKFPGVMLGAEVHYFDGISHYEGLRDLCFEGTNLMLLEMPFRDWSERLLDEVANLHYTTGIMPIAAHIERYSDQRLFNDFMDLDIFFQSNAHFIYDKKSTRKACKLLKSGTITFIGSDAHNTDTRPVNMGLAEDAITKALGSQFIEELTNKQFEIISDYSRSD